MILVSKGWRFVIASTLTAGALDTSSHAGDTMSDLEAQLTGKARPHQIPSHWIGSPIRSAPGWRWDDPDNSGSSVRIFRGDPADPDPTKRAAFVVVVSDGRVLNAQGKPVPGE